MEVENQSQPTPATTPAKPRWRRAMVASSTLVAMLIVGTGFLPPILLQTSLRDRVIGAPFADVPMKATASAATGGWFTPLTFQDVHISDDKGQIVCTIKELRTTKGMLGFITDRDDVGRLTFFEPKVSVKVAEDGKWPEFSQKPSKSRLVYEVVDGELDVSVPWRKLPIVDVAKLDITGKIGPGPDGRRTLIVDATQVFDHEPLSEAHTEQNFALIAPVLSQSTTVSGSASVWLDTISMPLEGEQKSPFPIRGRAEFHTLDARLKEDWIRQLAALTGGITGTTLPDRVEVVKDSDVQFEISETGIRHEGMVFLFPEIAKELQITSEGTIQLDESLDLSLSVKVPKIVPANRPMLSFLSQLTAEPIQLAVKGTVSKPKLEMPQGLTSGLLNGIMPAQHITETPAVPDAISGIIQSVTNPNKEEAGKQLTGSIFNMIKAIDQNAKQKAAADPDAAEKAKEKAAKRKKRRGI